MEQFLLEMPPEQIDALPYSDDFKSQVKNDPEYKTKHNLNGAPMESIEPVSIGGNTAAGGSVGAGGTTSSIGGNVAVGGTGNQMATVPQEPAEVPQPQNAGAFYQQIKKLPVTTPEVSVTGNAASAPSAPATPFDPASYANQLDSTQKQLLELDNVRIDQLAGMGVITPEQAKQQKSDAQKKYESETTGRLVDIQKLIKDKGYNTKNIVASQNYNDQRRLEQVEAPIRAQQAAVSAEADARAQGELAKQALYKDAADQQIAMDQAMQEKAAKNNELKNQALEDYKRANDELGNMKVDPNRMFRNQGAGQQVITMLGAMLSGYFAGKAGSKENPAMNEINKQIDRDIDAQKTDIETAKARVTGKMNQYQMLRSQGLDDMEASKILYLHKLENVQTMANSLAGQYNAPQVQAQAQQVNAQFDQKIAQGRAELSQLAEQRVIKANTPTGPSGASFWKARGYTSVPGSKNLLINDKTGQIIDAARLGVEEAKGIGSDGKVHIGQRAQGQIVAARNAKDAAGDIAKSLGMDKDKDGHYLDPSWYSSAQRFNPLSDEGAKFDAAKLSFKSEIGKAQTGGILSQSESHDMQEQLDGAKTPQRFGELLRHYDEMMDNVEKNVRDVAGSSKGSPDSEDAADDAR